MAKVTLTPLASLTNQTSAIANINNNMTAIATALENTVSRDGTSPNTMGADLDMNGFTLLNLGAGIGGSMYVTLSQVEDLIDAALGEPGLPATSAVNVSYTPSGSLIASNVQTALEELQLEKLESSSYTAADVLTKIKTVDGEASGLDADLLDGQHASYFATGGQVNGKADNSLILVAGAGLIGGGDLTTGRSFAVVGGNGITVNADNIELTTAPAWSFKGRPASTTGNTSDFTISGLPEKLNPSTDDYLLIQRQEDASFAKVNIKNFPAYLGSAFSVFDDKNARLGSNLQLNGFTITNTGTLTFPTSTDTIVGRNTTDTLTNKTLTFPSIATINNGGTVTVPSTTDTLVARNTTDTLTNKTLTTPNISTIINTGTLTLPTSSDTLVGRATTDTLTNKTLTSPTINAGTFSGTIAGTPTFSGSINLTKPVFVGQASPTYAAGALTYDTDNECLTFFNNDSNVSLQIGQEQWIRVRNVSGSTILNGKAVYVNGANTGLPTIALASNAAGATSDCVGLATEDIPNNSIGYITTGGRVNGVDTSGFAAGATLYLGNTAGSLTTTIPSAPLFRVKVGSVGVSNATTGTIHVALGAARLGLGTANQIAGMDAAGTGSEYKTLSGTANKVSVTHAANLVTLSLPQALVLDAGTATAGTAPLKMTSGTVLTTPEAGAIEYDGTVPYITTGQPSRDLVNVSQMLIANADLTGQNIATTQTWFQGQTLTGFNVVAGNVYEVEGILTLTRAAGTTSHTTAINWTGSATATYFRGLIQASTTAGGDILTAASQIVINNLSSVVVTAASIVATESVYVWIKGILKVNAGGTLVPNFTYSAIPGGAPTIKAGSYMKLTPIGNGNVVSIGSNV